MWRLFAKKPFTENDVYIILSYILLLMFGVSKTQRDETPCVDVWKK